MTAFSDAILAETNLLHYWKLNEAAGAAQSVNTKTPGVPGNIRSSLVAGVPGWDGTAIKWRRKDASGNDLAPNDYWYANPAAYSGAHSFEMLAYFGFPAASGSYLFGTRGLSGQWSTELTVEASTTKPGKLALRCNIGNGVAWFSAPQVTSAAGIDPGWHHVVITVSAAGAWEIWVDAVSIGSGVWNLSGTPLVFDGSHYLVLGNYSSNADANWALDGRIQHFAVYSKVLLPVNIDFLHYQVLPAKPVRGGLNQPTKLSGRKKLGTRRIRVINKPGTSGGVVVPTTGQTWPRSK